MRPAPLRAVGRVARIPLYRNAGYLILNTAIVAGPGLLFWLVVDKLYAGDVIANSIVLIQTSTYLGLLATLGFGHGWVRFLPSTPEDRGEVVNSCLTVALLASLGLGALFLGGVGLWYPDGRALVADPRAAAAFLGFVLLFTALPLADYIFVARRSAGLAAAKNACLQGSKFLVLAPLLLVARPLAIVVAFGAAAATTVVLAYAHLVPRVIPGYRPGPRLNPRVVRALLRYSLLSHLMEMLTLAPGILLLILVNNTFPEGAYPGVASTFGLVWVVVGTAVLVVPASTATSLFAEGSHAEANLPRDLRRALRFVLPLLLAVTGALLLGGRPLLSLFHNVDPALGVPLLQVLALSGAFYTANALWMAVRRVEKRMVPVVLLVAFIASFTLGATLVLLPRLGVLAAGYAWLAAQGLGSGAIGLGLLARRLARGQQRAALGRGIRGSTGSGRRS